MVLGAMRVPIDDTNNDSAVERVHDQAFIYRIFLLNSARPIQWGDKVVCQFNVRASPKIDEDLCHPTVCAPGRFTPSASSA